MATIITGEDYEKYFDHDCYLSNVYDKPVPEMQDMVDFVMNGFHEAFTGINKSRTLLDIGSGPCVHAIISASNKVDEIYMSDYSQRCIDRLNSWLKGEMEIQTKEIKYVCQLENKGQTAEERVNQMRSKVKQICFIDLTKAGSLKGNDVPKQFDVVTSCWCLESCGQPKGAYETCAANIVSLVKTGGYFVLIGNLDCTDYILENNDLFPLPNVSEPFVRKTFEDVGFKILSFKKQSFTVEILNGSDTKLFSMFAQKI